MGERDLAGRVEVCLLGVTRVRVGADRIGAVDDAVEIVALGGAKPRQLLELLALHHGHPLAKEWIAEQLWEGDPPRGWLATLESYVALLRRTLAAGGAGRGVVVTADHGYLLCPSVRCDLTSAREWLEHAAGDAVTAAGRVRTLGALLASSPYAAWADEARQSWAVALGELHEAAAATALAQRRPDLALRYAAAARDAAPWSETALALLMRAHCARQDHVSALACFADYRQVLARDLGIGPGPESTRLYLEALHACADDGPGLVERSLLTRLWRQSQPLHSALPA